MKRYDMFNDYDGTKDGITPKEEPKGKWVKWEDAEKLQDETYKVGYFTGENTKKVRAADHQTEGQGLGAKGLKCNCEEMYDTGYIGSWFCEAHGYKKR